MEKIEEIRIGEYLLRASPETIYEWFKAWPQRTPETSFFFGNDVPKEIEQKLLTRKNEIVDLALAAWGTNSETIESIYHRWCAHSVVADWPPQPSTYPYAVLASILANVHGLGFTGIPTEDFEWLIEHGDNDLFCLMHNNIARGIALIERCAEKSGAYGRIDDDRWLFALEMLGNNKRLHRIYHDYPDSPDLVHWDIHKSFVHAATISPKTSAAAAVLGQLFKDFPSAATKGGYVSDEALAAAVLAWDVEIPDDDESEYSPLKFYHESDALTPSERVRFHLLRHYYSYLDLDPDDSIRVRRLAAYSMNPVNGGKSWELDNQSDNQKFTGKGLDIENFRRYSERDGPAFMYASSFNRNIWCDKVASEPFEYSWDETKTKFTYPKDENEIYQNRQKCVDDAAAKKSLETTDSSKELDSLESRTFSAIGEVREELRQTRSLLITKLWSLQKWGLGGGIIVVALLLVWH